MCKFFNVGDQGKFAAFCPQCAKSRQRTMTREIVSDG
jgi:hypothetical protein